MQFADLHRLRISRSGAIGRAEKDEIDVKRIFVNRLKTASFARIAILSPTAGSTEIVRSR